MQQTKDSYSTFGRQVGYTVLANLATLVLGIVQFPILTKLLGASFYGIWSLINIVVSLIVPFAMLSFSMSIVRFLSAEKDPLRIREDFLSACCLVLLAGVAFAILVFALSGFLAVTLFNDAGAALYIRLGSALILLN